LRIFNVGRVVPVLNTPPASDCFSQKELLPAVVFVVGVPFSGKPSAMPFTEEDQVNDARSVI